MLFRSFCMMMSEKKLADLWEYQAIRAAYSDSLDKAITLMENAGKTSTLPGNPFVGRKNDCHDCDHAAPQKVTYTKMSFLKRLKEHEAAIEAGNNVHANAFTVANAFYNIGGLGPINARVGAGVPTKSSMASHSSTSGRA